MLDTCIAGGIQNKLTVLLKGLASQNLGEKVRRIRVAWNVTNDDTAGTSELAHLEKLAVAILLASQVRTTIAVDGRQA